MQRLSLVCEPIDQFVSCVAKASRASSSAKVCDQVRYLASYLRHREVDAKTIVVEHPYVDRHWLEEYAGYYSTLFDPPSPKATRLHFLDVAWTTAELLARLAATIGDPDNDEIQRHYVGFSVIRPLPTAPIGRTVLRPFASVPARCFSPAASTHRVHLAGLTIAATGLPFQQQDQGVAACATTAVWSALTKVIRMDGGRAPTPFSVTNAATDQRVQARVFPALAGLDLEQMATAIHAFGYQPHVFQRASEADDFVLALKTYLRSGIPVIVRARVIDGDLHAFTLAGFRERDPNEQGAVDLEIRAGSSTKLRSRGVIRWYAHDDRLGPYARLGFVNGEGDEDRATLKLLSEDERFEDLETPMIFIEAIVPLYPKLRLTAEELISFGIDLAPAVRFLSKNDENLRVDLQFMLGGEYLAQLRRRPMDSARIVRICTTLALSRYVGLISWYRGDEWLLDAVYDTTDLRRSDVSRPPLLAVISSSLSWLSSLEQFRAARFGEGPLIL